MNKKTNKKGVQGKRVKVEPEKDGFSVLSEGVIQRCKIIGSGNKSLYKIGDVIIVTDWLIERVKIGDEVHYYVPDEAVLEVL